MNRAECTIAVDGSLFRYHPRMQTVVEKTLTNLVSSLNKVLFKKYIFNSNFIKIFKFKIELSSDGSGKGAAVVAAVAAENDPIFK